MTKSRSSISVGDAMAPALKTQACALRDGADQAACIQAVRSPEANTGSSIGNLARCLTATASETMDQGDCRQILWFSFFFDGTGNNHDADVDTLKHSNIARLYRVHKDDNEITGQYRFYIPGVGTYFDKVRDRGGTALGLGIGDMGQERLDWALKQFDLKLLPHLARANSPANTIIEINISAFGFSRGAALARAFINQLLKKRCEKVSASTWYLAKGHFKIRVRFLGLFDTVASVGLPMSTNTTSVSGTLMSVKRMIRDRRRNNEDTLPQKLAFAESGLPGADPAPGKWNGHDRWGDEIEIPEMVEEVRHLVAAHEIRNSFPVDSISILRRGRILKPTKFYEMVYPGVHSDVGGSYRPGEGGRSSLSKNKLGLIPLAHMYDFALARGVPLLSKCSWKDYNVTDFEVSPEALQTYNHYMKGFEGLSRVGDLFNLHMAKYFAWRFRDIRKKERGDLTEMKRVEISNKEFLAEGKRLRMEIEPLKFADFKAKAELERLRIIRSNQISGGGPNLREALLATEAERLPAARRQAKTQDELLRAEARLNALPDLSNFYTTLSMYDKELINDALAIRKLCPIVEIGKTSTALEQRSNLRPHYRILLEAYENEYERNAGLKDPEIIAFFDNFVHDSLAGFAKDATLPSDPRVIYLGGNEKYRYAAVEGSESPTFDASTIA